MVAITVSPLVLVGALAASDDDPGSATGCEKGAGSRACAIYSDGTDCGFTGVQNPRSCREALTAAAKIATTQSCTNVARGGNWDNRCGEFVARAYGYRASGEPTALTHYSTLRAKGLVHTSRKNIPAGALVFFAPGNTAGHVALYAGNAEAFSNDYITQGCIDLTPMSRFGSDTFLGWAPPVFPNGAPL